MKDLVESARSVAAALKKFVDINDVIANTMPGFANDASTGAEGGDLNFNRSLVFNLQGGDSYGSAFLDWDIAVHDTPYGIWARKQLDPRGDHSNKPFTYIAVTFEASIVLGQHDDSETLSMKLEYDAIADKWSSAYYRSNTNNGNDGFNAIREAWRRLSAVHPALVPVQTTKSDQPLAHNEKTPIDSVNAMFIVGAAMGWIRNAAADFAEQIG